MSNKKDTIKFWRQMVSREWRTYQKVLLTLYKQKEDL